ncbi:MAG: replication-relaxation family protein [Gemmataceae bacterium]
MSISSRQIAVLKPLRRYGYLRTNQIRDLVIPHDETGSITRSVMRKLVALRLVRRHDAKLVDENGSTPPTYVLTHEGSSVLVAHCNDPSLLLDVEPKFTDWMSLNHYCGLSSFHILLDRAIAAQSAVTLQKLYFEHEVIRPNALDPAQKYRLYTVVADQPRIIAVPDSAFETEFLGSRRAWYVERETGSDNPARVAAKKAKGYALLSENSLHRRHFPDVDDFRVLALCPSPGWRDALRREMKDKPVPTSGSCFPDRDQNRHRSAWSDLVQGGSGPISLILNPVQNQTTLTPHPLLQEVPHSIRQPVR